ncbi:hypothetical protein C8R44DRAFT_873521 [Mycena epipterygia]|nr:hypothetical protein C8R44DRAFT_873521 [Mycena epipterygia]
MNTSRNALQRKTPAPSGPPPTPGTIDPVTGFINVAAPPTSGRGSRRRNFTQQMIEEYGTADAMRAAAATFDRVHSRPSDVEQSLPNANANATAAATAAFDPVHSPTMDFTRLRRCLAALVAEHPQFASINVEKLIDARVTVEQLSRFPKSRIPDCDFTFSMALYMQFTRAVGDWLATSEIEECVVMLVAAFPGVVKGDLAAKLRRDRLKVVHLLECNATEMAEYGIVVDEPVWADIRKSIEEWMDARMATDS